MRTQSKLTGITVSTKSIMPEAKAVYGSHMAVGQHRFGAEGFSER